MIRRDAAPPNSPAAAPTSRLTARNEEKLVAVAAELRARHGVGAVTFPCDLRATEAPKRIVDPALAAHGGVDLLVNSAGATKRGGFLALTDEVFLDAFALKFHGAVRLTRVCWPHLKSSNGTIVNIIGIGANTPAMDFTIGGPVNSALINFTKAIADRDLVDGVRVNAINPGHVVTDRYHHRIEVMAKSLGISTAEAQERARRALTIHRFGRPEEIAVLAAFLSSTQASYIHGATIDIDGGATKGL